VLLPGQRHGGAIDGQVDIVHDRAFFDVGPLPAGRTGEYAGHLLDHQLDVGTSTHVGEDADVFETHQRSEDLIRVTRTEVLRGCWLGPQPWSTFA
jgi:hypothetical protein